MIGAVAAARDRRARTVPMLLAAILLQAAGFFVIARTKGADAPYLTLKTIYLAIYPLAIGGAIAAAARSTVNGARGFSRASWLLVGLALIPAARLVRERGERPCDDFGADS